MFALACTVSLPAAGNLRYDRFYFDAGLFMSSNPKAPSIFGQLLTCALLCAVAVTLTELLHPTPAFSAWQVGLPIWKQAVVAAAFAVLAIALTITVLRVPRLRGAVPIPPALASIDLSGMKPLQIGLAAGVGEELLFRAALQPLLGLWLSSAIFAFAHIRTASFADSVSKRAIYMLNVFFAGLALGLIYVYVGLLAAVLVHATIDVASLMSLHLLRRPTLAPTAAAFAPDHPSPPAVITGTDTD